MSLARRRKDAKEEMARFKFRLATLLRLRDLARDERRAQLAEAYRAQDLLDEQKRQIEEHLADVRRRVRLGVSPGEIDVDRLMETRRFEMVLVTQRAQLDHQQRLLSEEIERRRQALVEANREVQILEHLRTRQQERYQAEEARREMKDLDEVAQQRAAREARP
jgi:flagellar protein FliJ